MILNNIYCCNVDKSFDNIVSVIELFISICTLIIAAIGAVCVYSYRAHQKEAIYGFYQNLKTFLLAFRLYTSNSMNAPPAWMKTLGKKQDEIRQADEENIKPIAEFCSDFFAFLSTTSNQIPPSRKKRDRETWNRSFDNLRECLFEIKNYNLQAYPKWSDSKINDTYDSMRKSINNILNMIDNKCTDKTPNGSE
jgi:hypothetical protein